MRTAGPVAPLPILTAGLALLACGAARVPGTPTILIAVAVVGGGAVLIARRVDVRLVLVLGALPLFAVAGRFPELILTLAREMANHRTVVPICSAIGFAYVLKLTECDQHLVQLLLRPLRRVRPLLVPGGVAAGYVVNSAIVSQTGTAAVVGPILIPLLLASGATAETAGAALLLGCSMGGELFNPGAVEVATLSGLVGVAPRAVVERMRALNWSACGVALLTFWALAALGGRRRPPVGDAERVTPRVNWAKAAVPLLPLVLLYAAPGVLPVSRAAGPTTTKEAGGPADPSGSAAVLAAMLIGVAAAGVTSPGRAGRLASSFFEGAGYGYTHVISLIVAAGTFAEGLRVSGLIDALAVGLARLGPAWALLLSIAAPWGMAIVSGTGIAPAVAVMNTLVPLAGSMAIDPIRLGTVIALAAHFGRTMSPVAAVVFMCATLTDTSPLGLVRRVIVPLLAGGAVLFLATALRLV